MPAGNAVSPASKGAGGDQEAGAQDRFVPDAGEEEDTAEDEGAEAAEEGERADVGQGHRPVPDHRRLEDGVGVTERALHQPGARDGGQREGAQDARAVPAPVAPLDDGGDEAGHRDREERGAEQIGALGRRVAHLAELADPEDEGEHAEGEVDQEDPAPAGLDQQAADRRAERGGGAADGRPQPDGRALALGTEGGEQEPQRGRAA